ncbi:MAG: autotransporter outer membrane beta-barrel domain-containing protein, partial [Verrucomicrobiales bacterium]|nr:autotransporter outer membrane beta-barrel domain-containing protein [Verrucomicrobiales bacterium]
MGAYISGTTSAGIFRNVTITTTGGHANGLSGSGLIEADGVSISTNGSEAYGLSLERNSHLTFSNGSIHTTGIVASGVHQSDHGSNYLYLENTAVVTEGAEADGILMASGTSGHKTLIIDGGSINAGRTALSANKNPSIASADLLRTFSGTYDITIKGGASLTGQVAALDITSIRTGTDSSGTLEDVDMPVSISIDVEDNSKLIGDVNLRGSSAGTFNMSGGSLLTGNVNIIDASNGNVNLNHSVITGDIITGHNATLNVNLDNQSQLTGNVNGGDGAVLTVRLENSSTMAGNITASGTSDILLYLNNHSRHTGNIADSSNGILDIYLANDSHGKGNWQHGNLTMDNTSTWEFTSGTSIIDNLNNDGKIIFGVNTDDGTHATLDVTGTASGTGQIDVSVSGTTTISDTERDLILNDLVQGNGKGAWDLGEMDWGLIVVTPTTAPDGSIYTTNDGKLSTAGNIAVGLISAQKGSWFAQQNSLLKRMGEIRLLNDAYTQTLAGKDDKAVTLSAENIMDNIWIRAYGQQLNFSASVTGQAFKQYVYGTDIGTDHKFTLNNSNVLYTGIFAGYGAADTDHRHNGSKSDLSNYYAGLYGSWLNNSGWYLDATLKAQYTNNSLNGSNGVTSFTGSYNNWSVGGSIELGKQFKFQDDWFIEPQFQANYVHILA